ncbi:MAG: GspH/FimT family pseudopilin [Pseudomonadota bacterium]
MNKQKGFSLIELMIAVALFATLITIGVPSFITLTESNRITSDTNDLISALSLARSEALKRGDRISLCSSTDGASCADDTDWTTGWIVFLDDDGDGVVDAGDGDDVLRAWEAVEGDTNVAGSAEFLTYQGNGSAATHNFNLTIPGNADQSRRILLH